jgi:hypothetical protein
MQSLKLDEPEKRKGIKCLFSGFVFLLQQSKSLPVGGVQPNQFTAPTQATLIQN